MFLVFTLIAILSSSWARIPHPYGSGEFLESPFYIQGETEALAPLPLPAANSNPPAPSENVAVPNPPNPEPSTETETRPSNPTQAASPVVPAPAGPSQQVPGGPIAPLRPDAKKYPPQFNQPPMAPGYPVGQQPFPHALGQSPYLPAVGPHPMQSSPFLRGLHPPPPPRYPQYPRNPQHRFSSRLNGLPPSNMGMEYRFY